MLSEVECRIIFRVASALLGFKPFHPGLCRASERFSDNEVDARTELLCGRRNFRDKLHYRVFEFKRSLQMAFDYRIEHKPDERLPECFSIRDTARPYHQDVVI